MTEVRRVVLQLTGSPVDDFHADLSRLYARASAAALAEDHSVVFADVEPGGVWRFPQSLDAADLAAATPLPWPTAIDRLIALQPDVVLPQMFCRPGMTDYRALLQVLGLFYLGNTAQVMANAADKWVARALVADAGVAVPAGQVADAAGAVTVPLPVVVKPAASDNSVGVTLVENRRDLAAAIANAAAFGGKVLVESFVPLGREVRCGVLEIGGELKCLPLEEYALDSALAPIRLTADKLARDGGDGLRLVASDPGRAWIVAGEDPVVSAVWQAARACYRALGCRHYGLFDFRIDPAGRPWFLEAGPYCSFAPASVIAKMAAAEGITVRTLFDVLCREADAPVAP